MQFKSTAGTRAWVGLALYVSAYDIWAATTRHETLSMAFYKAIQHPVKRFPTIVVWATLTAHLFKFIPDRYDPLRSWGARSQ